VHQFRCDLELLTRVGRQSFGGVERFFKRRKIDTHAPHPILGLPHGTHCDTLTAATNRSVTIIRLGDFAYVTLQCVATRHVAVKCTVGATLCNPAASGTEGQTLR